MLYGASTLASPTSGSDSSVDTESSVEIASDEKEHSDPDVGHGQTASYTNFGRLRRNSSSPNTFPDMSQETQETAEPARKDESDRERREPREQKRRRQDSSPASESASFSTDWTLSEATKAVSMTQHHLDEATRYIHYQEDIITGLQNELKALTINHQDAVELLNTRTAELHAAQTFLSKTDTVSDSEIRQAIERLNAEIHQTAAAVSDSIPYSSDKGQTVSLSQRTLDNLAAILGKPLLERLKAVAADDEAIVQIALQARISRFASNYLQSFGNFDENNKALRSVWQSIRAAETQSVSGRWRALARQHAKKVPEFNNPSPVKLRKALAARIIEVVKSTGIQEDLNGLSWQLQERFGSKLDAIVQLILSIQKTILEDVIAYDFHPIIAYPGDPFDGTLMEDEYEDRSEGSKDKAGPVLCAVALGLTRNEMVMEDGQPVERRTIVLKTKVAMECVLKEFEQSE